MTREQKILKRKERAYKRRKRKNELYHMKIKKVRELGNYIPLSAVRRDGTTEAWRDSNSPTGYSQVCSYEAYGICQAPCNGDC